MAPELLNPGERDKSPGRTEYSDIYAFGMVVYEVLTGNFPFHEFHVWPVVTKVVQGDRPQIPADTPAAAHNSGLWLIVQQCWAGKPSERPTLSAVRQRLTTAKEMWDAGLGGSSSTDGYVDVREILFLSRESIGVESASEAEGGTSSSSFLAYGVYLPPRRATTPGSASRGRLPSLSRHTAVVLPADTRRASRSSFGDSPRRRAPGTPRGIQYPPHDPRSGLVARWSIGVGNLVETGPQFPDSEDPFLPEPVLITPDRGSSGTPLSFICVDAPTDQAQNLERPYPLKPVVEPESDDDCNPPAFVYESSPRRRRLR